METKVMFYNATYVMNSGDPDDCGVIYDIRSKVFHSKEQAIDYLYYIYLQNLDLSTTSQLDRDDFVRCYLNPKILLSGTQIYRTQCNPKKDLLITYKITEQEDFDLAGNIYYQYDLACRMEDVECELERRGIKASKEQIKNIAIKANDVLSDSDEWWYAIDYAIIQFQRGRV